MLAMAGVAPLGLTLDTGLGTDTDPVRRAREPRAQSSRRPGGGRPGCWHPGSQLRLARAAERRRRPGPSSPSCEALAAQRDAAALDRIAYWDAGAPGYRWNEIACASRLKSDRPGSANYRALALLNVAIYDATSPPGTPSTPTAGRARRASTRRCDRPADPAQPGLPVRARRRGRRRLGRAGLPLARTTPQLFADPAEEAASRACWPASTTRATWPPGWSWAGRSAARVDRVGQGRRHGRRVDRHRPDRAGLWPGTNPVEPLAGTWKTWALAVGRASSGPARRRPTTPSRWPPSWPSSRTTTAPPT